jgi:mannose-6-phosphate isomerase
VLEPRPLGGGLFVYDTPAPEFRLYRAELGDGEIPLPGADGPRIVLCTEGAAALRADDAAGTGNLAVGRGESCFIAATDGAVTAAGPATVFIAASGLRPLAQA